MHTQWKAESRKRENGEEGKVIFFKKEFISRNSFGRKEFRAGHPVIRRSHFLVPERDVMIYDPARVRESGTKIKRKEQEEEREER